MSQYVPRTLAELYFAFVRNRPLPFAQRWRTFFFFLPAADNARLPQDEKSPPTRRNSTMVCLFDVERTSLNWLMSPAPNTVTLPVSVVMSSVQFRQKLKVWGMVAPAGSSTGTSSRAASAHAGRA